MKNIAFSKVIRKYESNIRKTVAKTGESPNDFMRFLEHAATYQVMQFKPEASRCEQVLLLCNEDGTAGVSIAAEALRISELNNGGTHLIISGGDRTRETRGSAIASEMFDKIRRDYGVGLCGDNISIDSYSQYGYQRALLISAMLKAMNAKEVGVITSIFHMPRLLAATGFACRNFHHIKPKFFPMYYGDWGTRHSTRFPWREDGQYSPDQALTYADIAFAPALPRLRNVEGVYQDDKPEFLKIIEGWDLKRSLLCHCLAPHEAYDFFDL